LYGYAIIALAEGKTLQDLQAWGSVDAPPWVNDLKDVQVGPGTYQDNYDLNYFSASYQRQPLYFLCFAREPKTRIGEAVGPVEVSK
jgi:hypothetical protein